MDVSILLLPGQRCRGFIVITQALRRFQGGGISLIRAATCGYINGYSALADFVDFIEPPSRLRDELRTLPGHEDSTFKSLLVEFLVGEGFPDEGRTRDLISGGVIHLNDSDLVDPGFRSRLLYQAATGCTAISSRHRATVSHTL